MGIKITFLIPFFILLLSVNQRQGHKNKVNCIFAHHKTDFKEEKTNLEFHDKIVDTLTNWQLYLDDKLILKSHHGNEQEDIIEIKTNTEYQFFKFQIFYDFHHDLEERKIELIVDNTPFKTFTETNETILPFSISKQDLELIPEDYFNREIRLKFYDSINPYGLEVATIKIVKE